MTSRQTILATNGVVRRVTFNGTGTIVLPPGIYRVEAWANTTVQRRVYATFNPDFPAIPNGSGSFVGWAFTSHAPIIISATGGKNQTLRLRSDVGTTMDVTFQELLCCECP